MSEAEIKLAKTKEREIVASEIMNIVSRSKHDRVNVMCIDMRELFRRANAQENLNNTSIDDTNAFSSLHANDMYTPCTEHNKTKQSATEQWIRGMYVKNSVLPPLSPADPVVIEEILHDPHPLQSTHSSCYNNQRSNNNNTSNSKAKTYNNTPKTTNRDTLKTQRTKNHSTFLPSHTSLIDYGNKANAPVKGKTTDKKCYCSSGDNCKREKEISVTKRETADNVDKEVTTDKLEDWENKPAVGEKMKRKEELMEWTTPNDGDKYMNTTRHNQHLSSANNNLLSASVNALSLSRLRQMTNILHSYRVVNSDNNGDDDVNHYNNIDALVDKMSWGHCPFAPHVSSSSSLLPSSVPYNDFSLLAPSKETNLNANTDNGTLTHTREPTSLKQFKQQGKCQNVTDINCRPKRCIKVETSKFVQQILRSTRAQITKPELAVKKNEYSNERTLLQQRWRRERIGDADVDEQRHIPRSLLWTRTANKLNANLPSRRPKQR